MRPSIIEAYQSISYVFLSARWISSKEIRYLCSSLTLTDLEIDGGNITTYKETEAFVRNKTLTRLHLIHDPVSDRAAKILARNTTLIELGLNHNVIGNRGAYALAKNNTLLNLYLNQNQIEDWGVDALAKNTTLTDLELQNNQFGLQGIKALAKNPTLIRLDITGNKINGSGFKALVKNISIITLKFNVNKNIKEAIALRKNTTLTTIYIRSIHICDTAIWELTETNHVRHQDSCIKSIMIKESGDIFPMDILRFIFLPYLHHPFMSCVYMY